MRATLLPLVLAAGLAAGPAADDDRPVPEAGGPVQDPPGAESLRSRWGQEPGVLASIERGLAFLAAEQATTVDGSFPKSGHRDEKYAPIGVTALGALAFLAAGNAPDRGPYGAEVTRAVEYLLDHANLDPASDRYGYISRGGDTLSRIHGHGFSTLTLSQAWVTSPRSELGARIERALVAAVRCIEDSQGSTSGGWYYEPEDTAQHEGSTTVCLLQALRAARDAGVHVDGQVIARAEGYLEATQHEDTGRFAYMKGMDRYSAALTAAGIVTYNAAGRYDDPKLDRALRALLADLDDRAAGRGEVSEWPLYERFYIAQALWFLPELTLFEEWAEAERARLLSTQNADGSWTSLDYGDCYATAINCLVLSLPEELLPIFLR